MDETSAIAVTTGPAHHFFGYYDKSPWSADGSRLLCMRYDGAIKPLTGDEVAEVGWIDVTGDQQFHPITTTQAWCWQQGCMLQWLPTSPNNQVIYNRYQDGKVQAVVHDIASGDERTLPLPIYSLSRDGMQALSLSFARLAHTRPGYGYPVINDLNKQTQAPADDGLWQMDMQSGEHRLIFSLADTVNFELAEKDKPAIHWLNHAAFNTTGSRISVLHRYQPADGRRRWATRLITLNPDGSDPYLLNGDDMTSHYDWLDEKHFLAYAGRIDIGDRYFMFTDQTQQIEIIGEDVFDTDGHMSYSPNRKWFVTDTYPSSVDSKRTLMLYNPAENRCEQLGRFYSPPVETSECRCDLHPRWDREGKQICIDSMHKDGQRQMYIINVESITSAPV